MFYLGYTEAAKPNNACAQQRGCLQIIKPLLQRKRKIGTRDCIFSIAAVHAVAGESRRIAKVFPAMLAIPAASIHAANPRDANASARRKPGCTGVRNLSNNLVARNDFFAALRQFTLRNVQVCSTNAAGTHTKQNMAGTKLWSGHLANVKWTF